MEYLNVYDSNKKKLNKKIVRGESLPDGEHILVTVIFIKNSEGKYLMQKTSKEKGSRYSQAKKAIEYYKKLFKIEDEIADLSPDEKLEKRQELSKPIFEEFISWFKKMVLAAGKDKKLYKAFNYIVTLIFP